MRKRIIATCAFCSFVILAAWAAPQKNQKKKPVLPEVAPASISDQIDHDIGEMLGAWQIGDIEAMHKYYADDATWVSGTYDMPIVGWQNYAQKYEQQRKGFTGIQLIRKNTNVFHYQDTAWACYQWEFDGLADGRAVIARGQTTLVFVKKGDQWLIVHNHTSEICPGT